MGVSVVGGVVTGTVVGGALVVVGRGRVVVVVEDLAVLVVVAAGAFGGLAVEDPHPARMSSAAAAVGRHARIPRMSVSRRLVQSFYSAGTQESFVRTKSSAGSALDGASRAGIMRGAQERLDGRPCGSCSREQRVEDGRVCRVERGGSDFGLVAKGGQCEVSRGIVQHD